MKLIAPFNVRTGHRPKGAKRLGSATPAHGVGRDQRHRERVLILALDEPMDGLRPSIRSRDRLRRRIPPGGDVDYFENEGGIELGGNPDLCGTSLVHHELSVRHHRRR